MYKNWKDVFDVFALRVIIPLIPSLHNWTPAQSLSGRRTPRPAGRIAGVSGRVPYLSESDRRASLSGLCWDLIGFSSSGMASSCWCLQLSGVNGFGGQVTPMTRIGSWAAGTGCACGMYRRAISGWTFGGWATGGWPTCCCGGTFATCAPMSTFW
jgi:hypothetical protein